MNHYKQAAVEALGTMIAFLIVGLAVYSILNVSKTNEEMQCKPCKEDIVAEFMENYKNKDR